MYASKDPPPPSQSGGPNLQPTGQRPRLNLRSASSPRPASGSGSPVSERPAVPASPPSSKTGGIKGASAGETAEERKKVAQKSKAIAEEFYHNKDMKELVTCVRDELDMAKNGPTVISTWLYGTSETLQYKTVHSLPHIAWEEALCAGPTVPVAPTTRL